MKILITGGGTGGHLYPALAVADALKPKIGAENILFVGSNRGMESREVPEAGYGFRGLESVGLPSKPSPKLFKAVWTGLGSVRTARATLSEWGPDVVFSTGGYASAPVVFAAWIARLPIILHEQNSVPGRANRLASRVAARVFLGFSSARRFFPRRGRLRLSGNPLREQVLAGSRARAIRQFRLEEGRKTVLVLGGSQGAHSINQAMVDALGYFGEREDVQFLIQSGQRDHEWMVERCREQPAKSWVRRFIPNMGDAYEVADLVVARAGAMTISELSACGLPSILIPYPHAMDDHQMLNADQLREGGASILIEDRFLTGKDLHDQIVALLDDTVELRKMAMNARRMARPDATQEIAKALLRFGAADASEDEQPREDRSHGGRDGRGGDRGRRGGWTPHGPRAVRDAREARDGRRDGGRRGPGRPEQESRGDRRPGGGNRRRSAEGSRGRDGGRRGADRPARPTSDDPVVPTPAEKPAAGEPRRSDPSLGETVPVATPRPAGAGRRRRRRRGGSDSGESRSRGGDSARGGEDRAEARQGSNEGRGGAGDGSGGNGSGENA